MTRNLPSHLQNQQMPPYNSIASFDFITINPDIDTRRYPCDHIFTMVRLFMQIMSMCVYLSSVSGEIPIDRFSSSYLKARQESRGSRTWISSASLVVIESEDSDEDHIDKNGYELCDAIGYDSTSIDPDNVFFNVWCFVFNNL